LIFNEVTDVYKLAPFMAHGVVYDVFNFPKKISEMR